MAARGIARSLIALTLLVVGAPSAATADVAPAPNDNFADATMVPAIPFIERVWAGDATVESGEPAPSCGPDAGRSVWYVVDAPTEQFDLATLGSYGDTVMAVYTGSTLETLTEIACSDNAFEWGPDAFLRLTLPQNTAAFVQVSVRDYSMITFEAGFSDPSGSTPGDMSSAPIDVQDLPFTTTIDTTAYTTEPGEQGRCGSVTHSAWLRLESSSETGILVSVVSHSYPNIAILRGPTPADAVVAGCGSMPDDGIAVGRAGARIGANETAWIHVGTAPGGGPGPMAISVAPTPVPSNDDLERAQEVSIPFELTGTSDSASVEQGETSGGCGDIDATTWYRFTAADAGPLVIQLETYTARFSLWRGTSFEDLAFAGCSYSSMMTPLTPGQTYFIQVDTSGESGPYRLRAARGLSVETFPLVVHATEDGRVDGSAGGVFVRPEFWVDTHLDDGGSPEGCVHVTFNTGACVP
jgi:hypothetical protein